MSNQCCRVGSRFLGQRFVKSRILLLLVLAGGVLLFLQSGYGLLWRCFGTFCTRDNYQSCFCDQIHLNRSVGIQELGDTVSSMQCVHPELNPYDPVVMQYYQKGPTVDCSSAMEDWVYVADGIFHISERAKEQYGDITCDYVPVMRDGDFEVRTGPHVKPMLDGTPILTDFFEVTCESAKGKKYTKVHAAVARDSKIMERLRNYHSSANSHKLAEKAEPEQMSSSNVLSQAHTLGEAASLQQSLNLSVLVIGFDSLSHMAWIRLLPKTRKYLLDSLGGLELQSYNILGDGTPAALLPILTGKLEEELADARRGYKGAQPVDNHPWLWKEFSKRGYATAYAEDSPRIGTVQYRMLGFDNQPTDHYLRTFYLSAEKTYSKSPPLCLGSVPRHVTFFNWFGSLMDMYKDFPKFLFGFYSEMSHDNNNKVQAIDDDLVFFLQELEKKGHLNSTMLILMADHGARYNYIRATAQGKLEERMPYFSFRFPPWFHRLYPNIIRNMHINSKRLTTPYDIHATFRDILNFSNTNHGDVRDRAISLFKEIPQERTCSHADVTPHWCACVAWQPANQSDPLVVQAANSVIKSINSFTKSKRSKCAELSLLEITKSYRYMPNSADRSSEWTVLKFNKKAPPGTVELYQVSFKTTPGEGHFEVTCTYDIKSGSFSVDTNEISRINKYGSQPACIQASFPLLRPYCYCV